MREFELNLRSLLNICGFDDIRFHTFSARPTTLKQRAGEIARWPILRWNQVSHRLFGVNVGGQFASELVVSAKRNGFAPLFNSKFK